ncbi:hypothetical protein [Paraburkholderia sp. D1E]
MQKSVEERRARIEAAGERADVGRGSEKVRDSARRTTPNRG